MGVGPLVVVVLLLTEETLGVPVWHPPPPLPASQGLPPPLPASQRLPPPLPASQGLPPPHALKFMKKYGYLEQGTIDSEALYTQEAFQDAIKVLQKFGSLPETGIMDNTTLKLMSSQRCGNPDVLRHKEGRQKRYIIGSEGWKKREITYFVANWSPKLGEEAVVDEIQRAFDSWSGYSRLTFRHVRDNTADIIIAFGRSDHRDGYPFDGPGGILAHAFYPYEMGSFGGDIHFDDDEEWKINPGELEDGVDFFTVAVHELGHSLGLSHSPVSSSIMFPYYKGFQRHFQLDYDDILAMYQLYISRTLEGDNQTKSETNNPDDNNGDGSDVDEHMDDHDNDDNNGSRVDEDGPTTERPLPTAEPQLPTTTTTGISFNGDDESMEDHIKHGAGSTASPIPDICEGNYDSVANLREELFFFKGKYLWRLSQRGKIQPGYPVLFRNMFWKLPETVTKIDAAYQRQTDNNIIFFTGNQYWVYDGDDFVQGSPRSITDYGFPHDLNKIDAVMIWKKNGKTFFYAGDKYWRFNETEHLMDVGYPHNITRWRGVPSNLDAAMTWADGFTYFFKDRLFWRFDNHWIKTDERYPLPAAQNWLGCPEKLDTIWW